MYNLKIFIILCLTFVVTLQAAVPIIKAINQSKSPIPDEKILNVAHRGASAYAPEHTLVSYQMGKKMKGSYIEIDLQMTSDGHLIAMHDERVDRTTNGTGLVKNKTLNEIKELDAGSWYNEKYPQYAKKEYEGIKVPTLEEVFKTFGRGSNYYIETKSPTVYPGMEEKLLKLLEEYNLTGGNGRSSHVILQSFSSESLKKIHHLNENIPLVQLISYSNTGILTEWQLASIKEYAIGIGPSFKKIDQEYVKKVRQSDLHIHPYTINSKEDMEKAIKWGVTGIFTNHPDVFQQVLKELACESK
ncbi:glycerophosphodiester phosphodiesterase [Metabacillus litoralis]|uniref:glycerophosphodiester phosphodiesterase n=1 Tax=Metabacillus litoralis TaxID=152268 RepID=UPI001CFD3FC1|nr:glycerophosphodiester phosphodiesterase [Metabacillus litoralis]